MRPGLRELIFLLLLGAAFGGLVGEEPADRFVLIVAEGADSLERKLRAQAAEGRRIVGACHGLSLQGDGRVVVLMERPPGSGEPFEYLALSVPGDLGKQGALDELNDLGARGYRLFQRHVFARPVMDWWLPTSAYGDQVTLIVERSPDSDRHRYATVAYSESAPFRRTLDEHRSEGFRVLGLWNTFRRPRVILEKSLDVKAGAAGLTTDGAEPYRLLVQATKHGLKSALERNGAVGYRVLDSTDQAIQAPPIVILEKAAAPSDDISYKLMKQPLKKIRKEKLEDKLNKRARKGYRVLPSSVTGAMLILERESKESPSLQYRALSSKVPPGVPRGMEELTARGYRFVAMFHSSDETTVLVGRPLVARGAPGDGLAMHPLNLLFISIDTLRADLSLPETPCAV
jgi:hypothetical protein